jgi:hypothetical protein
MIQRMVVAQVPPGALLTRQTMSHWLAAPSQPRATTLGWSGS